MELKRDRLLQGGRYRIIESIGRGGFGITYLAEQVMAKRKVCIKEFFPKDYYKRDGDTGALTLSSDGFAEPMNKFKAKFVKEAQTIAALDHHNIIPIYDVFEENNTAYYVMEYIDGVSLSSIVKESGALSEDVAVGYIKQIASALEHIHELQIMHLDVKPGNIMVRSKDDHAILIDFGLSKHYDENSGEATSTTPVGVSHGYAPMEQYKQGGVNRFSPETDIYSLGATLYYIATGIVPPHAADMGKDGIGELPSELSSGVCAAIRKSMNYWKEDRPHTIKEFLELLDSKTATPIVPVVANEKTTLDSNNNIASEQKSTPKPAEQKQKTEQKQTPKATPTEKKATEPKAAPAEKKAVEPKKEWTPKYSVNKPKTSENETSKKRKSLWWLWLLLLLLIGGVAYLMFMGGDNAAPISNTTKTAKPQLDTFEQIVTDSINAMAELNVEDPNITAEDAESNVEGPNITAEDAESIDGAADIDTDEQSSIEAEKRAKASLKLTKTSVTIPSDKGSKELSFTLKDPYDGLKVSAESNVKWITIKDVGSKAVYYDVAEHTSTDDRTGTITVSYNGKDFTYKVTQQGKEEEHQKPSPEPQPTSNEDFTVTVGNVSFKMIWVEGGSYWMGSPGGVGDDDEHQHKVTLDGYWIAETEVTQGLWRAVMNGKDEGWTTEYGKGPDYPAYNVSYNEAIDFCNKLNELTGNKHGFRLPTEAEWEYAARGGNKSRGFTYSGSDTIGEVAWYWGNSNSKTHVVKKDIAANELGIYDMSGNVWEWCSDWYGKNYYKESPQKNPKGPSTGVARVLRGGSWSGFAGYCRVANRNSYFPGSSFSGIGFRLAVSSSL